MHFKREKFSGKLQEFIIRAESGNADDVNYIMGHLTGDSTFAMTRYVDYALSWVENEKGVSQIEYYLFNGTLIQRNYSCLFFNRRGDFDVVNRAFNQGLIDEIQTFSR
jgi:hypothetical protein